VRVDPLVRCIDRPTRLADRAYLFEVSIGQGKMLVSGFNFPQALESNDPTALFFFDQLVRYGLGRNFAPVVSLAEESLRGTATK
jgi:hypothetical protein